VIPKGDKSYAASHVTWKSGGECWQRNDRWQRWSQPKPVSCYATNSELPNIVRSSCFYYACTICFSSVVRAMRLPIASSFNVRQFLRSGTRACRCRDHAITVQHRRIVAMPTKKASNGVSFTVAISALIPCRIHTMQLSLHYCTLVSLQLIRYACIR